MGKLADFIADQIQQQVQDRNFRWLLTVPLVVVGLVTSLGLLTDFGKVANLAIAIIALWAILALTAVNYSRMSVQTEKEKRDDLLNRYGDRVRRDQETNPDLFWYRCWHDEWDVSKGGDTTISRTLTIVAGEVSLPAFFTTVIRNSSAHITPKIRERVKILAQYVEEDGAVGANIVCVPKWEADHQLRVFVYFDRDMERESERTIRVEVRWPEYFADASDGKTEVNHWTIRMPCESLETIVRIDSTFSTLVPTVTSLDHSVKPSIQSDPRRGTTLQMSVSKPLQGREYGYRLTFPHKN